MNDGPLFEKHRERVEQRREERKERIKDESSFRRLFGFGLLAGVVLLLLNLLVIGAVIAVVLWVALTILQHFGVLMLAVGVV